MSTLNIAMKVSAAIDVSVSVGLGATTTLYTVPANSYAEVDIYEAYTGGGNNGNQQLKLNGVTISTLLATSSMTANTIIAHGQSVINIGATVPAVGTNPQYLGKFKFGPSSVISITSASSVGGTNNYRVVGTLFANTI